MKKIKQRRRKTGTKFHFFFLQNIIEETEKVTFMDLFFLTLRLAKELEDKEKQLTILIEEQTDEQQKWQEELQELRHKVEQVRKQAEEATQQALQDEIAAIEKQRDVAMAHIETWQKEVHTRTSAHLSRTFYFNFSTLSLLSNVKQRVSAYAV